MKFSIEKFVSQFIPGQVPSFYEERGPNFIVFMQEYYRWLEQTENAIGAARKLYDYRDIDNTIDDFLVHFQTKYLYGIPFKVVVNLRFLLKHVLDVYRSKGSERCYKILFRLIYNLDSRVYLPGRDILVPSDGTWIVPYYLEVSYNGFLDDYIGYAVKGVRSQATGIVESYTREAINGNLIDILHLSHVDPLNATFVKGESVMIDHEGVTITGIDDILASSSTVRGSLNGLTVTSSTSGFNVGDTLAIMHIDSVTGNVVSSGVGGFLRVAETAVGIGQVILSVVRQGYGYSQNASCFIYRGDGDSTGRSASFEIFNLASPRNIDYNTDILYDYSATVLGASTFGFPANPSGNVSSTWQSILTFRNQAFGGVLDTVPLNPGSDYTVPPFVFVYSTLLSNNLPGTVSYTTASNTVTLSGGAVNALSLFAANDVVGLQANSALSDTLELQVIRTVTNSTSIVLYGPPKFSSTASAEYFLAPSVFPASFSPTESIMFQLDGSVDGENAVINSAASFGKGIVSNVSCTDSGRAYIDGEFLRAYLYRSLTTPLVIHGGSAYSNGDTLLFPGGQGITVARGIISTDANGSIVSTNLSYPGFGYDAVPTPLIQSNTGSGAVLQTSIDVFNLKYLVTGTADVGGLGTKPGYWTTTKGFINSDKYIQDDFYYQNFSYEIQASIPFSEYKPILYPTIHTAGTEFFGKFVLSNVVMTDTGTTIGSESSTVIGTSPVDFYLYYLGI